MNLHVGQVIEFFYERVSEEYRKGVHNPRNQAYTVEVRKATITKLEPGFAPDVYVELDGRPYGMMQIDVLKIHTMDTIINLVKDK